MMPKVERRGDCSILGPFAILACLVGLVLWSARNWREAIDIRKEGDDFLLVTGVSRDRRDISGLKNLVTSARLTMGDHVSFLVFVDDGNRYREIETWDSTKVMTYRELLAGTGVRSIHKSHDHWMSMVKEGFKYSKYVIYATADYQFKRGGSFGPLINNHKGHFAVMNHHKRCGTELQGFRSDSEVGNKILRDWVGHPMREFNSSTAVCIPNFAVGIDLSSGASIHDRHFTPRINSTFVKNKVNNQLNSLRRLPSSPPVVETDTITAVFLIMLPVDVTSICDELQSGDCTHSTLLEKFVGMLKSKSLEYDVAVVASLHLPSDSPHSRYVHWEEESVRISHEHNINTKIVVMDDRDLKNPSSHTVNVLSDASQRAFGDTVGGYCVVNPMAELPVASGWESLPHKFKSYQFVGIHDPLNSSFCIPATSKKLTTWIAPPALSVSTAFDWYEDLFNEPKTVLVNYHNKQAATSLHPDYIHKKPTTKKTSLPLNEYGVFLSAARMRFSDPR
eukprot:TRINITY_DN24977_c0_g1_i1.p1 TRINITY_DN24977_c0_g1~~TRINITY_DN24977_c0_g1_i1.p1  ORF type:complete len:506 (+),score=93.67 TRINITY_DN24977_c0_g1_i1:93-1610(+)